MQARGFNLTRTFSGTYREVPGSFKIKDNTLAPKPGRYASPWVRKGEKYDLDAFDDAYFRRLKSFVSAASERGVVVEYVLFCPFYDEGLWNVESDERAEQRQQGSASARARRSSRSSIPSFSSVSSPSCGGRSLN